MRQVKTFTIYDTGSNIDVSLGVTNATCNGKGAIKATISGGTAGFSYTWTGPVSGSISTSQTSYNIDNLPAGNYSITIRDSKGCEITKSTTVQSIGGSLSVDVTTTSNVACEHEGSAVVLIGGGTAPYTISYTGPTNGSVQSNANDYQLTGLIPGDYTFSVTDVNGCAGSKKVKIYDNGTDLALQLIPSDATCNGKGAIKATISGGTAGFSYTWTGPVSGSISTSQTTYNIDNLPAGTYSITIRDSKGCEITKSTTVQSIGGSLSVNVTTTSSVACEHEGSAVVLIGGGTAPYTISYTGPTSGSVQSNANDYQLAGLKPGDYTFNVTDVNGCAGSKKVKIYDNGSDLAVELIPSNTSCGGKGMMQVNISGGVSNYKITWSGGGINGEVTTGNSSFVLTDLPIGTYTVEVKDGIGCSVTASKSVSSTGGTIGLQLVPNNDVCGQGGSIEVRISGGTADYQIDWTGPTTGSATSSSNIYQLNGLSVGNYSVTIKDASGCEAKEWVAINTGGEVNINLVPRNANCIQSGEILVNILSGSPNYTVSWTGPSSGSQIITTNVYKITSLSEGTYSVTVKDAKGCDKTESLVIGNDGSILGLTLTNNNTSCGAANGNITATVSNGEGDYTFSWSGPESGSTSISTNTYSIWDLPSGIYAVSVLDKNGCSVSKNIQINSTGNDLGISVVGKNAACGQPSSIQTIISNGVPNFKIEWTGPSSGTYTTNNNSYTINSVLTVNM